MIRRLDGRPLVFVVGGAYGLDLPRADELMSFGADDAAPPARTGRAPRTAVPWTLDPRRIAVPPRRRTLSVARPPPQQPRYAPRPRRTTAFASCLPITSPRRRPGIDAALRSAIAELAAAASGLEVRRGPGRPERAAPGRSRRPSPRTSRWSSPSGPEGAPREIAEAIAAGLPEALGERLAAVEVAGPGFLNLSLGDAYYRDGLGAIAGAARRGGVARSPRAERINVEFVSANPTGPMHIGHARNAAYGDALARLLAFHGHEVEREFYVNDFGSQVKNLALSIQARARARRCPRAATRASTSRSSRRRFRMRRPPTWSTSRRRASQRCSAAPRRRSTTSACTSNRFFSERTLHEGSPSPLDRALDVLKGNGELELEDGAWWLRTERRGDDKAPRRDPRDREPTYTPRTSRTCATSRSAATNRQMLVLGADHHGYMGRMRAAFEASVAILTAWSC